jgi:hypothetical protein
MPRLSADPIAITVAEEPVLNRLVRAHGTPQKLSERARTILLAAGGTGVREVAGQLDVWPKTVRHWLHRWRTAASAPPPRTPRRASGRRANQDPPHRRRLGLARRIRSLRLRTHDRAGHAGRGLAGLIFLADACAPIVFHGAGMSTAGKRAMEGGDVFVSAITV